MTLKRLNIETLQTMRDELQRLADSLEATAKLADENADDPAFSQVERAIQPVKYRLWD